MAPKPYDPLDPERLRLVVQGHWREHNRERYRRLRKAGTLEQEATETAAQVIAFADGLPGDRQQAASEALREIVMLPATEDDDPEQ